MDVHQRQVRFYFSSLNNWRKITIKIIQKTEIVYSQFVHYPLSSMGTRDNSSCSDVSGRKTQHFRGHRLEWKATETPKVVGHVFGGRRNGFIRRYQTTIL